MALSAMVMAGPGQRPQQPGALPWNPWSPPAAETEIGRQDRMPVGFVPMEPSPQQPPQAAPSCRKVRCQVRRGLQALRLPVTHGASAYVLGPSTGNRLHCWSASCVPFTTPIKPVHFGNVLFTPGANPGAKVFVSSCATFGPIAPAFTVLAVGGKGVFV